MTNATMSSKSISIAGRAIGKGHRTFFIAEAGVNHNGDIDRALRLIDIAVDSGADAVKFQSFRAELVATAEAPKAMYQLETTGASESQREMLAKLELSHDDHRRLIKHAASRGILFLSTPFDEPSVDLLDELGIVAFKLPSGELTNLPFLAYVAKRKRPMIVSTGMGSFEEVRQAIEAIRDSGNDEIAILQCVSNYPADPADTNLRAMATMSEAFDVPVGYSDHTLGTAVSLAAVALGACIVEKHFTIDVNLPGPDHRASLEPTELNALVRDIRIVESTLGDGRKVPSETELANAAVARRSLIVGRDLAAGQTITAAELVTRRPGTGLSPALLGAIVGRRTKVAIEAGVMLTWDMIEA